MDYNTEVTGTTVRCGCWKAEHTYGSVRVAEQVAKHHRESRGHIAKVTP